MTWSTEDLLTYLAGEASEADVAAIEVDLAADPALEARLMSLDPLAEQLRGAGTAISGPSESQVKEWTASGEVSVQAGGFPWWQLTAAAVVGAVMMGAGWFVTAASTAPDWRAQVATYQALYSSETIAAIAFYDEELTEQVTAVGARVKFNNIIQVTDSMDELNLLRAQILSFGGQPLGQIVFATRDGQPIALCLIERDNGQVSNEITMTNREGLASASFDTAEHSWLLIGTKDENVIARAAQQVMDQLAAL